MPISEVAFQGLRTVVEWNPHGAKLLYAILRETPEWVKYKDDAYGPLGLILFGVQHHVDLGNGASVPVKQEPFPDAKLSACKKFGDEWKQKAFTKSELVDAVEQLLIHLPK
jgi:hypothetical protein